MVVFFVTGFAVAEFFVVPYLQTYQVDAAEIKQAIQKIHKLLCMLFVNPQNIEATQTADSSCLLPLYKQTSSVNLVSLEIIGDWISVCTNTIKRRLPPTKG